VARGNGGNERRQHGGGGGICTVLTQESIRIGTAPFNLLLFFFLFFVFVLSSFRMFFVILFAFLLDIHGYFGAGDVEFGDRSLQTGIGRMGAWKLAGWDSRGRRTLGRKGLDSDLYYITLFFSVF
jgi:hypothetical protein